MNTELIEKVERRIREKPEAYNQSFYFDLHRFDLPEVARAEGAEEGGWVCGATACVAGHAVMLSGRVQEFTNADGEVDWEGGGEEVLGIDHEVAQWLFDSERFEATMLDVLFALRHGASLGTLQSIEDEFYRGVDDDEEEGGDE